MPNKVKKKIICQQCTNFVNKSKKDDLSNQIIIFKIGFMTEKKTNNWDLSMQIWFSIYRFYNSISKTKRIIYIWSDTNADYIIQKKEKWLHAQQVIQMHKSLIKKKREYIIIKYGYYFVEIE